MNRTHAPFFMVENGLGAWRWLTWSHDIASMHAACLTKAEAIGAKGYDTGMASHMIRGTVVHGHPTVFL